MKFYYDSKKKKAEDKVLKSLRKLENSKKVNKKKKAIGNNEEKKIDDFQKKTMLALKASKNEKMSPSTKGTLISAAIAVGLGLIAFLMARSEYKYQESVYNYRRSLLNAARGGGGTPDQSAKLRRFERENARLRAAGPAFTGNPAQNEVVNYYRNQAREAREELNLFREQERQRNARAEENRRNAINEEVRNAVDGLRELNNAVRNETPDPAVSSGGTRTLEIDDPNTHPAPHHNAFKNTPPRQLDLDSGYLLDECISRVVKDYGVKGMKKGEHVMEGKHVKEEPSKPRRQSNNTSQNAYNTLNTIKKTALGLGAASLGILGGSLAARALKARKAANSLNKSAKEIQSSWDRVNETNRRKQEALKQFENEQKQRPTQSNYVDLTNTREVQRALEPGNDKIFDI